MKKALTIIALALIIVLSILLGLQHCGHPTQPTQFIRDMDTAHHRQPTAPPAGIIPFGNTRASLPAETLFKNNCAACHGTAGNGQSYVAHYAGMPAVGNLTTLNKTPDELQRSLMLGRGAMPAYRNRLNNQEAKSLIQYILTHLQQQ